MKVKNVLIAILALAMLATTLIFAVAQTSVKAEMKEWKCEWNDHGWTETVRVYKNFSTYYASNDTTKYWSEVTGYKEVYHENYVLECEDYIWIKGKALDFKLQGYNCQSFEGEEWEIVCDSCTDGNCDGNCHVGGGETCVAIDSKGRLFHKNSAVKWSDKTGMIPVRKLEVLG